MIKLTQYKTMARKCSILKGKGSVVSGGYSNTTRATKFNPTGKRRRYPNMQTKRVFIPETGETVVVTASARGLKTLNKNSAYKTLKKVAKK